MAFADFRKAFKKPEAVIPITKEQMKLFMGEEPEVKVYLVTNQNGKEEKIPIKPGTTELYALTDKHGSHHFKTIEELNDYIKVNGLWNN